MIANITTDNFIIGGGVAGLIAGWHTGYKIIDSNPMGQLGLRFIPGIRILKDDMHAREFIDDVLGSAHMPIIDRVKIKVGYENQMDKLVELTNSFKSDYSLLTRGKREYEKSFLSSGEKEYYALTMYDKDENKIDPNDFYIYLFTRIFQVLKNREKFISSRIEKIDLQRKHIFLANKDKYKYHKMISTIRLDQFFNACGLHPMNGGIRVSLNIYKKNFYQCFYNNEKDIELSKTFNYIYSISHQYTRKTYFKEYIVYETIDPLSFGTTTIDGNVIMDKYEGIPLQLANSIRIDSFEGVNFLGRFAQWDHSIKSNEIIQQCSNRTF